MGGLPAHPARLLTITQSLASLPAQCASCWDGALKKRSLFSCSFLSFHLFSHSLCLSLLLPCHAFQPGRHQNRTVFLFSKPLVPLFDIWLAIPAWSIALTLSINISFYILITERASYPNQGRLDSCGISLQSPSSSRMDRISKPARQPVLESFLFLRPTTNVCGTKDQNCSEKEEINSRAKGPQSSLSNKEKKSLLLSNQSVPLNFVLSLCPRKGISVSMGGHWG